MGRAFSPLRYPGGKGCMLELTAATLRLNNLEQGHYAEPFAGGCGLALGLLYGGHVADIHINDIDPSIWAFWHSALHGNDELVALIRTAQVNMSEWHRQREIFAQQDVSDPIALGYAAFFLNRTNRSGVIKGGGVIGGLDQTGPYKIDCRFNTDDLVRRVRRLAVYRDRIHLTRLDALHFLDQCDALPRRSLTFIDPPYFKKGPGLYTSFYKADDHAVLAKRVLRMRRPWVVTYDDVPQIRALYQGQRSYCFDISYSLHTKRLGTELLIASKEVVLPPAVNDRLINARALAA